MEIKDYKMLNGEKQKKNTPEHIYFSKRRKKKGDI